MSYARRGLRVVGSRPAGAWPQRAAAAPIKMERLRQYSKTVLDQSLHDGERADRRPTFTRRDVDRGIQAKQPRRAAPGARRRVDLDAGVDDLMSPAA